MPLPRIGIEFEASTFRTNYSDFAKKLANRGWMDESFIEGWHNYNCRCKLCQHEHKPVLLQYPPVWVAQYDASLPESGAEFISTPFVPNSLFMKELNKQLTLFASNCVYDDSMPNMRGGDTSLGMHFHISLGEESNTARGDYESTLFARRTQALLTYFSLPAYVLAATCGKERTYEYRALPVYDVFDHHSSIAALAILPHYLRIEWRVWEAYPDKQYILGAMLTSAALTEVLACSKASRVLAWYNIREKDRQVVDVLNSRYRNIFKSVDVEELDMLFDLASKTRTAKSASRYWHNVKTMFDKGKEMLQ